MGEAATLNDASNEHRDRERGEESEERGSGEIAHKGRTGRGRWREHLSRLREGANQGEGA